MKIIKYYQMFLCFFSIIVQYFAFLLLLINGFHLRCRHLRSRLLRRTS